VVFGSCQKGFLDQVPNDRPTLDAVFQHRNTVEQFLANVYSQIPDEGSQRFVTTSNAGPWTGASDEAKYTWSFVYSGNLNLGSWSASDGNVNAFWTNYYQGIAAAGYFMANVDQCPDPGLTKALKVQYKAEARALRAIFYYYLIRMYGPVVLTGQTSISPDAPLSQMQLPRSNFDSCVNFIVSELDAAATDLGATPYPSAPGGSTDNYGRINRPVALAFKVETLLLAASPLFNGNPDYAALKNADGTPLISQSNDPSKWKKASDAAKAFITEFVPGTFDLYQDPTGSPYLSCRDVMLKDWNKEWIFGRPSAGISSIQYERCPRHDGAPSQQHASGGMAVTQTMVDAYFMANGQSPVLGYNSNGTPIVNAASGYQTSGFTDFKAPGDDPAEASQSIYNQWVNREPRFYVGVTYDNSIWLNQSGYTTDAPLVTSTQYSGNSGHQGSGSDYPPTGYICRKNITSGDWGDGSRALVLYRLANIYLDYAEALNESSPGDPDILKYVNLIRARAGVPQYDGVNLPIPTDMRDAIRRERRVELAFENVRYFDTRRWKIAEQTDNGPFYGLSIDQNGSAFYNLNLFETRVFLKKHYLFPMPQSELNIDLQLVQNTGW
jgi:hypothetical protein